MTWEMDMRIMGKRFLEQGRQEGKKEEREALAIEMIKGGEPLAKIKQYTKLTEAAIRKLAKTVGAFLCYEES
ncbi:MAG: hypothetical protein IJ657_06545 [Acidaminococcaceae bacterium]|nr:hypothetical protein [Acidaminococcaceae bacterium]